MFLETLFVTLWLAAWTQAAPTTNILTIHTSQATQTPTATILNAAASGSNYTNVKPTIDPNTALNISFNAAIALGIHPIIAPLSQTCQNLIDLKASQLAVNVGTATSGYISDSTWGTLHRNYQSGAIYCHDTSSGAHAVYGEIFLKWQAQNGAYGYPITDETPGLPTNPTAIRYNIFSSGGAIYWTPQHGAVKIYGDIYARWLSIGDVHSGVGYPITDETGEGTLGGRYNDFASGMIYWTPNGISYVYVGALPQSISFPWNPINFGQVTGSTTVTIYSNGDLRWVSNMHDNTMLSSYLWSEAWVLSNADGTALVFGQEGSVGPNYSPFGNTNDNNIDATVNTGLISSNWRAWVANNHWQAQASNDDFAAQMYITLYEKAAGAVIPIVLQPSQEVDF